MDELIEQFYSSFDASSSRLKSALTHSNSSIRSKWTELLQNQILPEIGWSDTAIEGFLGEISSMDANNFEGIVGMGEREGRIASSLVRRRHFGFAHGMGRSGNLKDSQPKAVGSTILCRLTHKLVLSTLRTWGFNKFILSGGVNVMPVCTGMSMMLALMAVDVESKDKKVIWLRIDQKSCLKAILAANLEVIVVEGKLVGDEIVTDLTRLEEIIEAEKGMIHSIVSCISCFAPRAPDSIVQVSKLAAKHNFSHIVNAAYGGASDRTCNLLNGAVESGGRIDAIVMSLDKNFMVPVGGAIIFGPRRESIERIAAKYAGRAGLSHVIDLFITLIGLGRKGLLEMKKERLECFKYFKEKLKIVEGIKVMETVQNDISIAIRLPKTMSTALGSQLFHRNISGARVIEINNKSIVLEGIDLKNFGAHYSDWKEEFCYLNVAAGVGSKSEDVDTFIKKLNKLLK